VECAVCGIAGGLHAAGPSGTVVDHHSGGTRRAVSAVWSGAEAAYAGAAFDHSRSKFPATRGPL